MTARYIFRMDDITPTMDRERFWALIGLFTRFRVKPLLGIVPDNRDPKLMIRKPNPNFWDEINLLMDRDLIDVAQHGYQHILERTSDNPLIQHETAIGVARSEFSGYSFQQQLDKVNQGREILRGNGVHTDYFFAPNHAFDHTTLSALNSSGFTAISDGHTLLPFKDRGLIFIPQQLWRPIWMPTGVFTICLHANEISNLEIKAIRQFLRTPVSLTRFTREVQSFREHRADQIRNTIFRAAYDMAALVKSEARKIRHPKNRPYLQRVDNGAPNLTDTH